MHKPLGATLLPGALALAAGSAHAQDKVIKIHGFGAKIGVVRIFGLNSEAAMKAAWPPFCASSEV